MASKAQNKNYQAFKPKNLHSEAVSVDLSANPEPAM
jgi:hypothetical protein